MSAHVRGLVRAFEGVAPSFGEEAFVADTASVLGDVVVGAGSSIWYGAVVRGDVMPVRVGARSNLQDLTVVHGTTGLAGTTVGDEVTVGHRVVLHGCTLADRVLVGMGSIVLDLAVIESDVVLGAGSLVTPRSRLESGWLYLGSPAKKVRRLTDADRAMIDEGWRAYAHLAERHR